MGLACSHGAFEGSYGDFLRLRKAVCKTLGGSYPPHYKEGTEIESNMLPDIDETMDEHMFYLPDEITKEKYPGLWEFLTHSDYNGSIKPSMCKKVAHDLESIVLPQIEEYDPILHRCVEKWTCVYMLTNFIAGCRQAHKERRSLLFR